jgi:5-methylthioadenosine/S-adenosylhomocysteine deaminase
MHIHTAQSQREADHIRTTHGSSVLEYLRDIGLLADDVVVAHLSFAGDADLDAVHETGARYAHCPTIYPRRGRYPRLDAIFERGITTGFGTDWMLNDPFEGMRTAMNVSRVRKSDPDFLPSAQALWFHTMGSARVLGLEGEIGSLEPGKKADLIAIDLNQPHLQPFHGGYPALVWYAKTSDVVTSIIDGRIVLDDRRAVHLDQDSIIAEATARTPAWRGQLQKLGSRMVFGPGCVCCGA